MRFSIFIKAVSSGIFRAVGGQFYDSLFLFIGFYLIGTPIGISLLLKTSLMSYGNVFLLFAILNFNNT